MKKRIFCFALCIVMLLTVALTGCKKKESLEEKLTQTATTLSMWVVTENENGVDAETAKIVSQAINAITNSRFKVRLVIKWLTKAEYRNALDQNIRDYIDVRASGAATETVIAEEQTEVNEWGFTVIKYPELDKNQVDIIYIEGEEMYLDYINQGWLFKMDDELSGASKKIKEYVNSALLSAAKRNGGTYAIPNNRAIGNYKVMLLNKALMAETSMDAIYDQNRINGLFNEYVYNYVETLHYKNDANIVPIAATYEDCLNLLAYYWNIDPDSLENQDGLSILGYYYNNSASLARDTALRFDSLFANDAFTDAFLKLKEYQLDGNYFGNPTEGQTAALTIKEMDYAEYISYKADSSEYYPIILKNPTVTAEDVYGSMFGICSKTKNSSSCMSILTFLNTNAEFRNLLQYGVEGETYRLETDPNDYTRHTVEYLSEHPYKMDIFKTGNAFIAYPEPGMDADAWENGRAQNLAVSGADQTLDLDFRAIAEASAASATTPTAGTKGYTATYTGGLSREILSQNKVIQKWIKDSDAQGKGTYLLKTTETSGQNTTTYCYFYNNQYGGLSTFSDDEKGTLKVSFGGSAGYELGYLSIYSRKNTGLTFTATAKGTAVTPVTTDRYALIPLDLLHTDTYQIRVSTNIKKTSVATNSVIWNWIQNDCASAAKGEPQVLQSSVDMANGKVKYTYLVYTTGMTKEYTVTANPTGTDTELTLGLEFNESGKALKTTDAKYAIWLVTVEADPTVTVNYSMKKDGVAVEPVVTAAAEDPHFTYCGTLDAELVRYLNEINKELVAEINKYETISELQELQELIEEMKLLLTPQKDLTELPETTDFTLLANFVAAHDLTELNYALLCATSTSAVEHIELGTVVDENETEISATVKVLTDETTGEAYVLLDSPFKLYYAWLQSNGYVSKK